MRNDALLLLLLRAAVGSFSFAAIQQAIKTPLVAGLVID
jgi:parvulin-like peptidyl-prolyl isomerase